MAPPMGRHRSVTGMEGIMRRLPCCIRRMQALLQQGMQALRQRREATSGLWTGTILWSPACMKRCTGHVNSGRHRLLSAPTDSWEKERKRSIPAGKKFPCQSRKRWKYISAAIPAIISIIPCGASCLSGKSFRGFLSLWGGNQKTSCIQPGH